MVTTRAVTTVAKIQKHGSAKATKITSRQHCSHGNSGSPPGNTTPLNIAELNLNQPQYENVLVTLGTLDEAGRPADVATDPRDDIEDLTLPLAEPTAPNIGNFGTTTGTGAVCIDDSPTHNHPPDPTPPTQPTQPPRSILHKSTDSPSLQLNNSTSDKTQFLADSMNEGEGKVIHNKTNKVLKEMTGDHYIEFQVKDFFSLFPVWPIVELALAPSSNSKDKMMNQFVQCVLALFGEIVLVNGKAAIAPIEITNDKAEDLITDKLNIPRKFTKLGKWLMMS